LAQRNPQATEILGWRTTSASKPLAIDELAGAIRNGDLYIPCERTLAELRTFVRESSGKMHGSPHDDRVMSLAIANQMLHYVWQPEYQVSLSPPKFSLAWFDQFKHDTGPERTAIGSFNVRS
jgi:hypothetical protein